MTFDDFTYLCLSALLAPLGYAFAASTTGRESVTANLLRMALAIAASTLAFLLVGNAVLHGDGVQPFTLSATHLFGRECDGSAVFHASAAAVGVGIFVIGAPTAPRWSVIVAGGLYGGLIAPAAMRYTWWGLLRSAGLVDTAGAIAIHLCAAAVAISLARLFGSSDDSRIQARLPSSRERNDSLPLVLLATTLACIGWMQLGRAGAIMQAPTTLRAAGGVYLIALMSGLTVGFVRGVLSGNWREAMRESLMPAVIAALVGVSAGAGRMPWWLAVGAAVSAGVLAIPARTVLAAMFGRGVNPGIVGAHLAGGLVAIVAAVPTSAHIEPRMLLVVQVFSAVVFVGVATCAAVVLLGAGKLILLASGYLRPKRLAQLSTGGDTS